MRLPKDILSGRAKKPEFYLCQADKTILGGLNVTNASAVFKFNSYSEISCEIHRDYQHPITGLMMENPLYDKVEALRLIYVVGFGYYQIQESNIVLDAIGEYKSISAYSLEYALCNRYLDNFMINLGVDGSIDGVKLLNQADISHSLIHLVLEKMPDWSVGHVDMSIQDKQRSFEVDHQAIYDFMLNDMCDTFGCVFEFDTTNNTINIYDEETYSLDSNIYVSMDTIASSVEISYNADDIITRLYVYGADDISIREVNLGLDYITNISYYCSPDWLGEELYNAYTDYCKLVDSYREQFSELMIDWSELYDQYSDLYNKVPDYDESYDDEYPTVYSKSELPEASSKNVYQIYKVVEGDATWYYKCISEQVDGTTVYKWVLDIDNINSFYTFPTPSIEYVGGVYKVYNSDSSEGVLYYKCESYYENDWTTGYRWVLAESDYGINMLKEKETCYLDIQEVQVSAGFAEKTSDQYDRYVKNYEKLINIQSTLKKEEEKAAAVKSQLDSITKQMNEISKDIELENNFTPEQIKNLNPFIREDQLKDDHYLITELDDDKSAMEVRKELLKYAEKEIAKRSQPQLSFSMSLANILEIPEFEPVIDNFETGNNITVEVRSNYVVKTQVLEVELNFEDMSDFNVTFGNLSSLYSQTDIHAALLSQAVSAGKSVAESSSYWKKGADTANSINNRIETGLIDANTSIKSTENQAISWDSHGMHLRKYANEDKTEYLDDQIWLNNEKIVFTDDNWRTAKMAIGKFNDINLGESYGIIAPSIVGTLLAGENLVIDSTKPNGEISSFRVDSTGARLYNSTFLMEKEYTNAEGKETSGQIMFDPSYGIVAGSGIYITESDGTPIPTFVDSNGNVQKDGMFPLNANFFLDANDGNAYFRGYVYAEDGYFSGTISGARVESVTGDFSGKITADDGEIGGWIIKDGILYSTGTGSSETNFVGLSSKYNLDGTTSDYAIWAGDRTPSDAPFWVKRDGSIYAKNGTFSGKLEAATGSFAGDISAATGTFKSEINVADNFIVDSYGNVTMSGSIFLDGDISWSEPPIKYQFSSDNINWHDTMQSDDIYRRESYDGGVTWTPSYQFVGKDGQDGSDGSDARVPDYIKSTYIDFSTVASPTIIGNEIRTLGTFQVGYGSRTNFTGTGYMGYAEGLDAAGEITEGVALSYSNQLENGDNYIIVTNGGVRMQAGNTKLVVTSTGAFYNGVELNTGGEGGEGGVAVFG